MQNVILNKHLNPDVNSFHIWSPLENQTKTIHFDSTQFQRLNQEHLVNAEIPFKGKVASEYLFVLLLKQQEDLQSAVKGSICP